jgi:hypothetical protein
VQGGNGSGCLQGVLCQALTQYIQPGGQPALINIDIPLNLLQDVLRDDTDVLRGMTEAMPD